MRSLPHDSVTGYARGNFVLSLPYAGSGASWAVIPKMLKNLWTKHARTAVSCQTLLRSTTSISCGTLMSSCMADGVLLWC